MNPELITWLNRQDPWLRAAADRLMHNSEMSDADITEFVEIIKDPNQTKTVCQPDEAGASAIASITSLRLLSLGPVEGIDALNPRSPLNFGNGNLCVVYGNNGSGKSGYTRIISSVCGKPHAGTLRGNIFEASAGRQACKVKYSVGGVESEIDWTPTTSIESLALVDIFDAASGGVYLESETEATFLPPELALLAELVTICRKVEAVLTSEESSLVSRLPVSPPEHSGTTANQSYGKIHSDWNEPQVASLVEWTGQHAKELEQLNATLAVADPSAAADKQRAVKQQRETLANALEQALDQLTGPGFEISNSLFNSATDKRRMAREAAETLRTASNIEGVGSDTWRAMWAAARDFATIEAYPGKVFPFVTLGAHCIFCQQELDEAARGRLTAFEEYVSGCIEKDATAAETALSDHLARISTRPTPESLQTATQAAELDQTCSDIMEQAWAALERSLCPLRDGICPESAFIPSLSLVELIQELHRLASEAEEQALALLASATSESRQIAETRRKELLAKKWVSEQADAIRDEVQRLKQVHNYRQWKRQTVSTGLSRKANELSQHLVTEAYIQRFNSELQQLGAIGIRVELFRTRAEQGRVKHSIRLRNAVTDKVRLSDVLSEGERRIISLAAFLADVTGSNTSSPFIFDDPISSLDQTWEERTIDRLIALSQTRQVIVFTHRLSFLGIITDKFSGELHTVHIRREPWGTGQPGEVPLFAKKPDKALTHLKNERLVRARRTYDTEGSEAYYPLGKAICSDLRILTERIVELVFLADVVQRHRRAVNTQGKIHHLAKILPSDCDMIDELMTKYSCYEHSQSHEAPAEIPAPDDIGSDIERLLTWHSEFKVRAV